MKKIALTLILLGGLYPLASAQTASEALRYSLLNYQGTARYEALGGSFNALGGDLSSVLVNPAAGSIYKTSSFEFTMGVHTPTTTSEFGGIRNEERSSNFYVTGAGFVKRYEDALRTPKWDDLTLTIGYSRTNDFNRDQVISGPTVGSRADYFADLAQGTPYEDLVFTNAFDAELAWYTYLIDTLGAPDNYIPLVQDPAGGVSTERLTSSGGQSEISFGLSTTYDDRLHLGFGIGIPLINYSEERRYFESGLDSASNTIAQWNYSQYLESMGGGINLKVGLIYRPVNWLRLAAAYHSPSWYSLEDFYSTEMNTSFSAGGSLIRESPDGNFLYQLRTPQRFHLGGAIVLAPAGLISVDYEMVDYGRARFNAEDFNYSTTNTEISQSYQDMGIWRFGTEWRVGNFYVRGGYQLWGSPVTQQSAFTFDRTVISGGVGFRNSKFQADVALSSARTNSDRLIYEGAPSNPNDLVSLDRDDQRVVVTLGFPFQ